MAKSRLKGATAEDMLACLLTINNNTLDQVIIRSLMYADILLNFYLCKMR